MKNIVLFLFVVFSVSYTSAGSLSRSMKFKADSSDYARAMALQKSGSLFESNRLFTTVINKIGAPKNRQDSTTVIQSYWNIAQNYTSLWDAPHAIETYNLMLPFDDHKFGLKEPYNADNDFVMMEAHHAKGILYSFLGDYEKAAREGLLAIENVDIRVRKLDSGMMKNDKASRTYKIYASMKDIIVYYYSSYYLDAFQDLLMIKDYNTAKKILQKAKKIDKEIEEDERIYKVGIHELADGDDAGVIKQLGAHFKAPKTTYLSTARKNITKYVLLAQAFEKTGDNKAALEFYKNITELSPQHKYAAERIAELDKIPGISKKDDLVPPANILPPPSLVMQPVVIETGKLKTREDSLSMAEKLYDKGEKFHEKKQYSTAVAYFSKAIELIRRPLATKDTMPLANAYYMRASAYLSAGEMNKGLDDIDKNLELRPASDVSHGQKALILLWKGDYPASRTEFGEALKYHYAQVKDLKEKIAKEDDKKLRNYYSALLNLKTDNDARYKLNILTGLILEGKTTEANELIATLKRDFPDNYYVNHNDMSKIYTEHLLYHDYAGGINALLNSTSFKYHNTTDNSLNLNNEYLTSLVYLGYINEKNDSTALALDLYQKVLIMSPGHKFATERIAALNNKQIESNKIDKTAPTIVLFAPAATDRGQTIKADKNKAMLVKGRAEDQSGISRVKINGKTLDAAKVSNGFFETEIPPVTTLEIQATDNAGNESRVYAYTVTVEDAPKQQVPISDDENYYALFVACSNYEGKWPPLNSTIDEAKRFGQVLNTSYNFKTDTIFNAGRLNTIQRISSFINEHNKPTDNLLIFFAGHGTMEKVDNEPVGYLVPLNAQKTEDYIARKDIAVLLNRSTAKHILFITDACLSEFMRGDVDAQAMEAQNSTDYSLPSRQLLTSSGTKRAASKSVLVPTIMAYLQQNSNKYLSVTDLYANVLKQMVTLKDSNPELALPTIGPMRIEGDKLGAFYFKKN